jgi:FAD/FMN-containing dehydrogenase/Fe-S oxidoreductase
MGNLKKRLTNLKNQLEGDFYTDNISRILYATDASAYREIPMAVSRPKNISDLKKIIAFAHENKTTVIPRTAGTSIAGQVVGNGIIVDVSKYWNKIIEINAEQKWVRLQPGVVLDELNMALAPYHLFFGPETSTSNRCMIGGMVGNNSCGAHSIIYGSTRDHLLEVKAILSDGSEVVFNNITQQEFSEKCNLKNLEGKIYRHIKTTLSNKEIQDEIRKEFPDPEVKRRNTGYAVDLLLETEPFTDCSEPFNFCKLIAGSEGTLAFITEIKLNLVPVPPKEKAVICVHLKTVKEALLANLIALKYRPDAVELMDKIILDCTRDNITQRRNRSFVEGDPGAIMIVEFARESKSEIEETCNNLINELKNLGYGYHYPVLHGPEINKVWALRKSGLGVLSNVPGDAKPVALVEDTAVNPKVLPDYIEDFNSMLNKHGLSCVYHAHIATGELHLRPQINIKNQEGVELFYTVALETAKLVKKYRGSLSGEHGDGRLRGEFISIILGEKNYKLFEELKQIWDPDNVFNSNKIVRTPSMKTMLKLPVQNEERIINTWFDFSKVKGILRAAENCNGAGDCRKSEIIGGVMCPSYMATRDEFNTTRARANVLREYLTQSTQKNPFDHEEIYKVMDLCLSCKGCKSECPSNVDITKLKAEFMQHWYDAHHIPFRTLMIAYINRINKIGSVFPSAYNFAINNKIISTCIKKGIGFSVKRPLPSLSKITLEKWAKKNVPALNAQLKDSIGSVAFYIDEFTNYNETEIGKISLQLLNRLGYKIELCFYKESGRTFLSKGMLRKARKLAEHNIDSLRDLINSEMPVLGIEPSCILTFRDEYPDLVRDKYKEASSKFAKNTFYIDEFLANEIQKGTISSGLFVKDALNLKLHGHCQQKALISTDCTKKILTLPENYKVVEIKSGCCGMAGSFGYEKEHYELSMKIGEMVLFPEIRKSPEEIVIAAPGTSCRHHIKDGTGKNAFHPVAILYQALK